MAAMTNEWTLFYEHWIPKPPDRPLRTLVRYLVGTVVCLGLVTACFALTWWVGTWGVPHWH